MTTKNPGYVTVAEAAKILNRTTSTVLNLAHTGFFDQKREFDGTRERILVLREHVETYRDSRDRGKTRPKQKEVSFPVKRESMDMEDWFAGQVLAGLCSNPKFLNFDDLLSPVNRKHLVEAAIDIARLTVEGLK